MSILSAPIYDLLIVDPVLGGMLSSYGGDPAIFTVWPAPEDAELPYIVTAGDVSGAPFDSKTTRGRDILRDVHVFAERTGSAVEVETIADRVWDVLHRRELEIDGYRWILSECSGPIVADERDAYGRIVSVRVVAERTGLLLVTEYGDVFVDEYGHPIEAIL